MLNFLYLLDMVHSHNHLSSTNQEHSYLVWLTPWKNAHRTAWMTEGQIPLRKSLLSKHHCHNDAVLKPLKFERQYIEWEHSGKGTPYFDLSLKVSNPAFKHSHILKKKVLFTFYFKKASARYSKLFFCFVLRFFSTYLRRKPSQVLDVSQKQVLQLDLQSTRPQVCDPEESFVHIYPCCLYLRVAKDPLMFHSGMQLNSLVFCAHLYHF